MVDNSVVPMTRVLEGFFEGESSRLFLSNPQRWDFLGIGVKETLIVN